MTPEGRIKKKIKALLDKYGSRIYYYMPVPAGYGRQSIDFLICAGGHFIGVEAKAYESKKPTSRQDGVLQQIMDAGGTRMVIFDDNGIAELARVVESVTCRWIQT